MTETRRPVLESWAARLGVFVIVLLSIYVGVDYWRARDPSLAALTVGAEIIAFAGLAVSVAQFPHAWRRGIGGLLVTFLAASWCAMTMYQKIDADSRHEAVARAQELPAYVFAKNAADTVNGILQERLRSPEPRPGCNCPQTVAAWEAAEAGAINRLRAERDAAVAQMQAAIPAPVTDWIAVARGIGIEVAKLFGFTVFWLAGAPQPKQSPNRQPFEVVEGGRAQPSPAPARPLRAGRALFAGALAWWALQTQQSQAVQSPPGTPEPRQEPQERVGDLVLSEDVSKAANALAAQGKGERAIAANLTARYGQFVSRWQVRKMLGRVAA